MPAPVSLENKRRQLERLHLPTLKLFWPVFRKGGYIRVMAECMVCHSKREYLTDNLLAGKTTKCRCLRGVKYERNPLAAIFGERFDAIKQRCENPYDANYPLYGGRRIYCRFVNREEFVRYMLDLCKSDTPNVTTTDQLKQLYIDRIDNNGHYEPGNLRLVSNRENNCNQRRTRFTYYLGKKIPAIHLWHLLKNADPLFSYSPEWVTKLAKCGLTGEEILSRARTNRRKGGRLPVHPQIVEIEVLRIHSIGRVRRLLRSE